MTNEFVNMSLDEVEERLRNLKVNNPLLYKVKIIALKDVFIKTDSILEMNKIALVFQTFKIHSSVPLIIEKLQSGNFDNNGGTLVYALDGLRKKKYYNQLIKLSKKKTIIYEMKAMYDLLGIR